jgi:hypothetical protein
MELTNYKSETPLGHVGNVLLLGSNQLDNPINPFWNIKNSRNGQPQIQIRMEKIYKILNQEGFYKLYQGKTKVFVRVNDNVITESSIDQIKDFLRTYIEQLPDQLDTDHSLTREDLQEKVYKGASTYLSDGNLSFLKDLKPTYLKDNKEEGFIFFQNCFVKVTPKTISCLDYSKLQGHIWESQIKKRNFHLMDITDMGDYEKLIRNVNNQDQNRFEACCSTLGYLLHSYKDPAITKAIIFSDEKIPSDDEANGGTCKSLAAKGVEMLKSTWYRGKEYRIDKPFPYQGITIATQIGLLDDMPKQFKFEPLFTNITNSLTVEGKGQPAFTLDFQDSPKWLITTNYVIKGEGASFDRRRHIVEFSDHYNKNPHPLEEFGRRLFSDWPQEEWHRFDSFMLRSLQIYLTNGLKEVKVNFEERKLIQSTSEEFIDFMEEVKIEEQHEVQQLKEAFCQINQDYKNTLTMRAFCYWLRLYVKHKQIPCQGDLPDNRHKPFVSKSGKMFLTLLANTPN